jgi:hypothetical protein
MLRLSVTFVRGASATPALFRLDDTGLQRPIMCVSTGVRREKEGRGNWKKMRKGAPPEKARDLMDGLLLAQETDRLTDWLAPARASCASSSSSGARRQPASQGFSTIQSQRGGDHPSRPIFLPRLALPCPVLVLSLSCLFRNPIPVPDVPPLPPTPHQSGEREEEGPLRERERGSIEAAPWYT